MNLFLCNSHVDCGCLYYVDKLFDQIFKYDQFSKVDSMNACDAIIYQIPADARERGTFNDSLAIEIDKSRKPIIVFDGSDHLKLCGFPFLGQSYSDTILIEYRKCRTWVLDYKFNNNIKAYFKINLGTIDPHNSILESNGINLLPWDLNTNIFDDIFYDSKDGFNSRPIDMFFFGGVDHSPARISLQKILRDRYSLQLIEDYSSAIKEIENGRKNLIVHLEIPCSHRLPINLMMELAKKSKFCVSQEGAGPKCFRHYEVSRYSILFKEGYDLVWSFPWIDGQNCIEMNVESIDVPRHYDWLKFPNHINSLDKYDSFINKSDLYDIYNNCISNSLNYTFPNYAKNYIIPKILEVL